MAAPPTGHARRSLSTGAVARELGVSVTTIWRAVQRGEIAATRLGPRGHYRIAAEDVQAWLQPTRNEEDDA